MRARSERSRWRRTYDGEDDDMQRHTYKKAMTYFGLCTSVVASLPGGQAGGL